MTTKKVEQVVDEAAADGGFSKDEAEAIKEAAAEDTPTPDAVGDPDAGDPPAEEFVEAEPKPDDEAVALAEEKAKQDAEMKAKPKSKAARKKAAEMEGPTAAGRTGNYIPADSPEYAARRKAVSAGRANYIP